MNQDIEARKQELLKEGYEEVYTRTKVLTDAVMHYCPGCGHGTTHRLVAEVIDEMGIQDKVVGVSPVGCSVLAYNYFDVDFQEAAHGRAPALATAIKRLNPDTFVFTYQGDGDLAAIGTAETIHAANRGENITMIFVNNGIYGMTGGQMAPTTLVGMRSATTPYGRRVDLNGYPLRMTELLSTLPGTYYVTRQSVQNPAAVRKAKAAIRKAFENQPLQLQLRLEDDPRGRQQVDGRQHDAQLPHRRHQSRRQDCRGYRCQPPRAGSPADRYAIKKVALSCEL